MRFLFQGDSITDAKRANYESAKELGSGYVRMLASDLTCWHPEHEVLNAGVSGNRVTDLLPRWKRDCLELYPDVLTILIGINDVWHEFSHQNGVEAPLFEEVYGILLRETKAALPDIRIILMGAYVMDGSATEGKREVFVRETALRRESAQRLAAKYGADYVDLQSVFEEAQRACPGVRWTEDGIHPTPAGHRLIADAWKRAYGENAAKKKEEGMEEAIRKALEILKTLDENTAPGHYEVSPEMYYNVEEYDTDFEQNRRFEAHRKHVDIQCILQGEEMIYVEDADRLEVEEELLPEKDVIFYRGTQIGTPHVLKGGDYLVFRPLKAHKPGVCVEAPARVKKAVFKITVG